MNKTGNLTKEQEQLLKEYTEYLKFRQRSYKNYICNVKQFLRYADNNDLDCRFLKFTDAQNYQYHLTTRLKESGEVKYQNQTIGHKIKSLKSFYEFLRKGKMVIVNPFKNVSRIRQPKKITSNLLPEEKQVKVLKALKNFYACPDFKQRKRRYFAHLIAELMYSTGARINEIAKIKLTDVDLLRGVVKITDTKSGKERTGFLNSYMEKILRIFIYELRDKLLKDRKNTDLSYLFGKSAASVALLVNEELSQVTAGNKIRKITSHSMRHSLGYHLLRAGCDIRYIKEILGHADMKNTQIYTKVDKEDLKGVIDKFHPRNFRRIKSEKNKRT